MSDVDIYAEADKKLALLFWPMEKGRGQRRLEDGSWEETWHDGWHPIRDSRLCPHWTQDSFAALALMTVHDCYPVDNGFGSIYFPQLVQEYGSRAPCVLIANHPDKVTAVRYAIVLAVIFKLEAQKGTP